MIIQTEASIRDLRQELTESKEHVYKLRLENIQKEKDYATAVGRIDVLDASVGKANTRKVRIDRIQDLVRAINPNLSANVLAEIAIAFIDYTDEFDVPISLLMAICRQESRFKPDAISPAGAEGICQIMPLTATGLKSEIGMRLYNPQRSKDNIRLSAYYVAQLMQIFNNDVAATISAYNTGPVTVIKFMKYQHCISGMTATEKVNCGNPVALWQETLDYKKIVLEFYEEYKQQGLK